MWEAADHTWVWTRNSSAQTPGASQREIFTGSTPCAGLYQSGDVYPLKRPRCNLWACCLLLMCHYQGHHQAQQSKRKEEVASKAEVVAVKSMAHLLDDLLRSTEGLLSDSLKTSPLPAEQTLGPWTPQVDGTS